MRVPVPIDPLRRREFLLGVAATAVFGATACAGKKDKAPKDPGSATQGMGKLLDSLRRRIKKTIPDDKRRGPMLALVDEAEGHLEDIDVATADWRAQLSHLPDDAIGDPTAALKVCETYNARMTGSFLEACKRSVALREHATAEEWVQLFPGPKSKGDA